VSPLSYRSRSEPFSAASFPLRSVFPLFLWLWRVLTRAILPSSFPSLLRSETIRDWRPPSFFLVPPTLSFVCSPKIRLVFFLRAKALSLQFPLPVSNTAVLECFFVVSLCFVVFALACLFRIHLPCTPLPASRFSLFIHDIEEMCSLPPLFDRRILGCSPDFLIYRVPGQLYPMMRTSCSSLNQILSRLLANFLSDPPLSQSVHPTPGRPEFRELRVLYITQRVNFPLLATEPK